MKAAVEALAELADRYGQMGANVEREEQMRREMSKAAADVRAAFDRLPAGDGVQDAPTERTNT